MDTFAEQRIDRLQAARPIGYVDAKVRNTCTVGGVSMGGYAIAQGPHQKTEYLGTDGIGSCIGVALVTETDWETYPRVTVGHIHPMNDLCSSIEEMYEANGHAEGKTTLYISSGKKSNIRVVDIATIADIHGAESRFDVEDGVVKDLIIDLKTGKPVNAESAGLVTWIKQNEIDAVSCVVEDALALEINPTRFEFNLNKGFPEGYQEYKKLSTGLPPKEISEFRKQTMTFLKKRLSDQAFQPH